MSNLRDNGKTYCDKCGCAMELDCGIATGPHGIDIENCRDPRYICICGNVIEIDLEEAWVKG